jgi:hypothetical protein
MAFSPLESDGYDVADVTDHDCMAFSFLLHTPLLLLLFLGSLGL